MIRFFVGPDDISGGTIRLRAEDAEHIKALRLRPAEQFIVCDGAGNDYICRLGAAGPGAAGPGGSVAEITEIRASSGEPTVLCSAYIAYAKGDRLDYAVQKSVELGAYELVLFPSERCVSVPRETLRKTGRLRKIALETAKQCGRGRVPGVTALDSFATAIERASRASLPLFLYECEDRLHLKQALERSSGAETISIVSGPEGGFEPSEAERAKSAGMIAVSLGPRLLRCETAPVAALAAVMYHTGNL